MSIKSGLVGLPNVGKSTLFNALTKSSVPAENYPFCTIEPHIAMTHVPDERLEKLQQIYNSQKIIASMVTFVDIAGLVKGAASGEGLGNQFLSHIREVDLILHVLRCFEDPDIIGKEVDPLEDYQIILTELMLKDLESITKRIEKVNQQIKGARNKPAELKELSIELELLQKIEKSLNSFDAETVKKALQESSVKTIPLLCAKNFLIIANVSESEIDHAAYVKNLHYKSLIDKFGSDKVIPICAKLEAELTELCDEEAIEALALFGLKERGLNTIIKKSYENLGLITFFTCGPKEIHAWPIKKGLTVRQAAGEIHSDLERGFICAEVFNYNDLIAYGSETKVSQAGKKRTEGQNYIVQDGDIILVKFNI